MSIYIVRPKTESVARSLNLSSRKFTPESRQTQVEEVVNFWQENKTYRTINQWIEEATSREENQILKYPIYSGITGVNIVEMPDEEAERKVYRQTGKHELRGENLAKQEGITVANQEQYLMVLGAPGAGKSTFLRKIGLEALKGKSGVFQHECIPVFIELKQFNNNDINIVQAIAQEFRIVQLPLANEFTVNALHQGKLLILLDGLDEVPTDNIDLVISQIQEFVEEYPKNRFIYSCRTAVYRRKF